MKILLSVTNPELKEEWCSTENGVFRFEDALANSNRRVWWQCKNNPNHKWKGRIRNRSINKSGCPYCSGRFISPERSLATLYPSVAAEWHPTKNGALRPEAVGPFSNKRAWWKCSSGHEWNTLIAHRTRDTSICPKCRLNESSLKYTNPELAAEWHPKKNLPLLVTDVSRGMNKAVWWQCKEGHSWQARIVTRAKDLSGCPKCLTRDKKPLPISMPDIAVQWHTTKNFPLLPEQLTGGSSRKVWWICPQNKSHIWAATPRTRKKGRGCPICSKSPSFADKFPELAKEWHPTKNGELKPSDFTSGSSKRVWWRCSKDPSYEWQATITQRTHSRGEMKACPHCSGRAATEKNSLALHYPLIAKEWHPTKNASLTPNEVTRASGRKIWWRCSFNPEHEWLAQVKNRTILQSGCPLCESENRLRRLYEALYESAQANSDFLKTFTKEVSIIRGLLSQKLPSRAQLRQPLLRMIYAAAITAMETYLCDAFFHKVTNSDALIERLLKTVPEFKERKYAITDILDWKNQINKKVSEYLLDLVWHNLARVENLYDNVLQIKFPEDIELIHRGIAIRHDLVHRNGRTKSGKFHVLRLAEIEVLLKSLEEFISSIDTQLKSIAS